MAIQQPKTPHLQIMKRFIYPLLCCVVLLTTACEQNEEPPVLPPVTASQTVLMYLPWAGNGLAEAFEQNIADAKKALSQNILGDGRFLVFRQKGNMDASLIELYYEDGTCKESLLQSYTNLNLTRAETITEVLNSAIKLAPAKQYGITIGAHGLGWLPATSAVSAAVWKSASAQKEYWEYTSPEGFSTRWFGDASTHNTDTQTLATAIEATGVKFEYVLFDVCFMSTIEVAYDLRKAVKYIIASPCEVMSLGFPYETLLPQLFTNDGTSYDLQGICRSYYDFYRTYLAPSGAIAVTVCSEVDRLATIMRRINTTHTYSPQPIQIYDSYRPHRFYDYGDYVHKLCTNATLRAEFDAQLVRTVPPSCRLHTDSYLTFPAAEYQPIDAAVYTGITTSDPSDDLYCVAAKNQTGWYKATH